MLSVYLRNALHLRSRFDHLRTSLLRLSASFRLGRAIVLVSDLLTICSHVGVRHWNAGRKKWRARILRRRMVANRQARTAYPMRCDYLGFGGGLSSYPKKYDSLSRSLKVRYGRARSKVQHCDVELLDCYHDTLIGLRREIQLAASAS